jgi:hypothetical protein
MPEQVEGPIVRPLRADEVEEVIRLWHVTKQAAYPYLPLEQGRTVEEDGAFFRAVRFGVSPPPESEPDVEYHWTPNGDAG